MPWRDYLHRGLTRMRRDGLPWLASEVFNRVAPARPQLRHAVFAAVDGDDGIEIGGPSRVFSPRGILPLYSRVARLDNVNFASHTAWEAGLRDGGTFTFSRTKPPGRQFLREATSLTGIADSHYDFVLSSHCLEHVANPLAALQEWRRIVRPGGHLILLLPDRAHTFDCARAITTLQHLRADLASDVQEDDPTHIEEILARHDFGRDPQAGSPETFRARAARNAENRCLHHHVFDLNLTRSALEATGWNVRGAEAVRPIHLVALAQRSAD